MTVNRLIAVPLLMSCTACVANRPWRTTPTDALTSSGSQCHIDTTISALDTGASRKVASACAEERLSEPLDGGDIRYQVHEIEFDDQGRLWNRPRAEESLARIEALAGKGAGARVVVFAHGWDNNARVCNGKLVCFRELLQVLQHDEHRFHQVSGLPERTVVGVFLGWRGQSIKGGAVFSFPSFWTRKATAEAIGNEGAATEILGRLDKMRCDAAGRGKEDCRTSVVFMGHSFGGQLMLRATAAVLQDKLARRRETVNAPGVGSRREVPYEGFGDLVLLENPAVEAEQYHNINELVSQFDRLSPQQLPLFVTISSEGDTANSILFPIGRVLSTVSSDARSPDQWQSMIQSIGTYSAYHTHRLVRRVEHNADDQPDRLPGAGDCVCESHLKDYETPLIRHLEPFYQAAKTAYDRYTRSSGDALKFANHLRLASYREFYFSRLEPTIAIDENEPFIIVRAAPEVVKGHSDLFNERYVDFIVEYIRLVELKREALRHCHGDCQ